MNWPDVDKARTWLLWYERELGQDHVVTKSARALVDALCEFIDESHRHPETYVHWRVYEVICQCGEVAQPFAPGPYGKYKVCAKCRGMRRYAGTTD